MKLALAVLVLTVALTSADAGARNLSVSEKEFEQLFEPATIEAAGNRISCEITLLGHFFERTMPKKVNSQIGIIKHVAPTTGVEGRDCIGGTMTVLTETLPWRLNYVGFIGALPDIERIVQDYVGMSIKIQPSGSVPCLAGTTAREPAFVDTLLNRTTGRVEGLRLDETRGIRLGGGFLCELAGEARLIGTALVLNLPSTGPVFTTLI